MLKTDWIQCDLLSSHYESNVAVLLLDVCRTSGTDLFSKQQDTRKLVLTTHTESSGLPLGIWSVFFRLR